MTAVTIPTMVPCTRYYPLATKHLRAASEFGVARRISALIVNSRTVLLVLATAVAMAPSLQAQPAKDDIPINLQVLPSDISHDDLMMVMGDFSSALGVGCKHCHLRADGEEVQFDYSSDELEAKTVAREMMRMTRVINEDLLPRTGRGDTVVQVQCVTCHHGQPRPRTLASVLLDEKIQNGVEASVAEYRRLRQKYYGRSVYDFGEFTLLSMARMLRADGEEDAELRILELNLEQFPESYMTYSQMASHWEARGDTSQALASYEEALRLSGFSWFAQQLERLRGTGSEQ